MKKLCSLFLLFTISWIAVPVNAQNNYYLTLYTDAGFGGTDYKIPVYQNVNDLSQVKLSDGINTYNDKTSSVKYNIPPGWEAILWNNQRFQGRPYVLKGQGEIANLGEFNDRVSSAQWRSTNSENAANIGTKKCEILLWQNESFYGRKRTVKCQEDIANLDFINSDDGQRGLDNKISSVQHRIPQGWEVWLYQHKDYAGQPTILRGDGENNFVGLEFNDKTSSVKWVKTN